MIRINIHEAKAHLSRYLDRLIRGERVVICRRNAPIAELRAIGPAVDLEEPAERPLPSGSTQHDELDLWSAIQAFRNSQDLSDLDIEEIFADVRDRSSGRGVAW